MEQCPVGTWCIYWKALGRETLLEVAAGESAEYWRPNKID